MHQNTTLTALLLTSAFACQQPAEQGSKNQSDSANSASSASASAPGTTALDPGLASAVQQVTKAEATGAPSAEAEGPPPNGILGAERANKDAPPGAAPVVSIGSQGSSPRVLLGAGVPADERIGQIEVSVKTGPRTGMPVVGLELEAKVTTDARAAAGQGAGANAVGSSLQLRVVSAKPAANQIGQLPPNAEQAISKLAGSELRAPLRERELLGGLEVKPGKDATPDLALLLWATSDALRSAVVSYPNEPVGKDAVWMTTSRETFAGTDVVAYRLYRLVELTPDGAVIDLTTRRYTAGGNLGLPEIAPHTLVEFQGLDEAQLRVVNGHWLPVEGRLRQRLSAVIIQGGDAVDNAVGQGAEQGSVQIEVRSLFAFPPKPGAADAALSAAPVAGDAASRTPASVPSAAPSAREPGPAAPAKTTLPAAP